MGDEFHLGTIKKNFHSFLRYINHPLRSFSSTQNILPCRILIFMIGLKWFAQFKTKTIVKNFNLRLIWILRIIMFITIYKGCGYMGFFCKNYFFEKINGLVKSTYSLYSLDFVEVRIKRCNSGDSKFLHRLQNSTIWKINTAIVIFEQKHRRIIIMGC